MMKHLDRHELRHDHRHEDGTEESNTWYGAFTLDDAPPPPWGHETRPSQRP